MKCRFCNEEIPDNSEFCLFCGSSLNENKGAGADIEDSASNPLLPSEETAIVSGSNLSKSSVPRIRNKFCKHCGNILDSETRKCTSCGKKPFFISIKTLLFVLMVILLLASIAYLVSQRINFIEALAAVETELSEKESFIHTLKTDNVSLEDEIKSLNDQIDESEKKISLLEKDSKTLDTVVSFLQSSNAGYASSNFKVSDKIFVVDKNDIQTSFTLTCGFSGFTNVFTNNNGTSADIVFTQDKWYGATTKLLISPRSVGTTIITFSNDQNTQTFKILIVVID